jgi:hypothetical protein
MKTVIYEGYTIKSFPQQGKNCNAWTIAIEIFWEHHGTPMTQSFTADTHYGSEEEADLHGITYGQRIIDGKVQGSALT